MRIGLTEPQNGVFAHPCRSKVFGIPGRTSDADALYDHVLAGACAARVVAEAVGVKPEDAFLAGLIQDIGRIVVHIIDADLRREALSCRGVFEFDPEVVDAMCDVFHADLGAHVADTWRLGPDGVQAITHHHHPESAPEAVRPLARSLRLGDLIARRLMNTEQHQPLEVQDLGIELEDSELAQLRSAYAAMSGMAHGAPAARAS